MVQVVLEEVVFGEVLEVGVLDQGQIRVAQHPDIHDGLVVGCWCRFVREKRGAAEMW